MKHLSITTSDGFELAAHVYEPNVQVKGGVLLAGAMATPQLFYRHFAQWLSEQGYLVLSFDYRGTFLSSGERGARTEASFDTWGSLDITAAARKLVALVPSAPRYYLGHSLGGQLFPSCEAQDVFERYIAVASGNGYWAKLKTWRARTGLFLASQVWAPVLVPILGYFPGKRLKKVGDLPKGVMMQWHRWCKHPLYLARDVEQRQRFEQVSTPLTTIFADDDEIFTEACIQFFRTLTGSQDKRLVRLEASATPAQRIGHHGYFKRSVGQAVWATLANELA